MQTSKAAYGFTLMEVLIGMTLLSIMVVLLFASLKTGADSWEKGERKIANVNETAVVYQFFKRHLATAEPLTNNLEPSESKFAFQGGRHRLSFVSAFPASAAKTGLQLFTIERKEDEDSRYLQVKLTPFIAPAKKGPAIPSEEVILLNHVDDISLSYFGTDLVTGNGYTWQDEWLDKVELPRLVKINITMANGDSWPDMIIAMKITRQPTEAELAGQENSDGETEGEASQ
ncbi:prepilin-type N-terminal cleavage/methylation domain-containing protein [Methylosoma difficile]